MRVSRGIRRAVTGLSAGAILLSAIPVVAQDWDSLRNRLLDRANELMGAQGFHAIGFYHEGSLNDGAVETVTLPLGARGEVILMGICDGDCSDLDLSLSDPSGNMVGRDLESDDVPIVRATPKSTGAYSVVVLMSECTVNPCRYAIQTFVN